MAESNNDTSWIGSWLSAAKNKSSEVLEFVKKDLGEFGSAVKNEATNVVQSTGSVLERTLKLDEPESTASSMKRSFSSFLGQMNTVLNPSPDDSDTEAILITEGSETVTLTKLQQAVYELQKDEKTFIQDPELALQKQFQCWLEIVDEQLSEERLTKHLLNSVTLNNQYIKLVPEHVSHQVFWKRYLFKKALLEDDLARKEAMEKREQREKQMGEENLKWDQEDFAANIELSEEEQIRLLEQYEKETQEKQQQKISSPSKGKQNNTNSKSKTTNAKKSSPKKTPKKSTTTSVEEELAECESVADDFVQVENKQLSAMSKVVKTDSSNSLDTKSSNCSSDGDWEKINDS